MYAANIGPGVTGSARPVLSHLKIKVAYSKTDQSGHVLSHFTFIP